MTKGTCCWLLGDSTPSKPHYCGKPTAYTYELGEDGKRYREYDTFCEEHAVKNKENQELIAVEENQGCTCDSTGDGTCSLHARKITTASLYIINVSWKWPETGHTAKTVYDYYSLELARDHFEGFKKSRIVEKVSLTDEKGSVLAIHENS